MIVNFSIQNFGPFKDKQTLSFEATSATHLEDYYIAEPINGKRLLKLALIYGANASGKTTILAALEFLRNLVLEPARKKTELLDFTPFLFDPNTPLENAVLSIEFVQNSTTYSYEVTFSRTAIIAEELSYNRPRKTKVFSRRTDLDGQFTEIVFGSKIKVDKTFEKTLESNTLWNNTVLGGFLKTNIELLELKDATDWFSGYLMPMISTHVNLDSFVTARVETSEIQKETLIGILKNADFRISNIYINNNFTGQKQNTATKLVEFEHTVKGKRFLLPIEAESQGTQRYFGFAGLMAYVLARTHAISIDELEASLHPDLYVHFLLSFLVNAKKSQIIATTHNREILADRDIYRNDAIWITTKNENESTDLYSLADFDSSVIRNTSSVYNAYKIGKLGGVPDLGDYYIDRTDEEN